MTTKPSSELYATAEEIRDMLPIMISVGTIRRMMRGYAKTRSWRNQLLLPRTAIADFIDEALQCPSKSSSARQMASSTSAGRKQRRAGRTTSSAPTAGSVLARALALSS
jgi:hypothetical protein